MKIRVIKQEVVLDCGIQGEQDAWRQLSVSIYPV
jgi:hypothetical protein